MQQTNTATSIANHVNRVLHPVWGSTQLVASLACYHDVHRRILDPCSATPPPLSHFRAAALSVGLATQVPCYCRRSQRTLISHAEQQTSVLFTHLAPVCCRLCRTGCGERKQCTRRSVAHRENCRPQRVATVVTPEVPAARQNSDERSKRERAGISNTSASAASCAARYTQSRAGAYSSHVIALYTHTSCVTSEVPKGSTEL